MVENRPKIDHLIKLYEAKQIPNYKTVFNATITLASKNKLTIKSGRGEKVYNEIVTRYAHALPTTGRIARQVAEKLTKAELVNYTKSRLDRDDLCVICFYDELEDGRQYERLQFICKHVFHSICLSKWCCTKKCLRCPLCGEIERKASNSVCLKCNEFVWPRD